MNIVIVGPFAFKPKGTVSVRALQMAKALKARGHEIKIILPPYDNLDESGKEYKVDGINIYNVNIPRSTLFITHFLIGLRLAKKTLSFNPEVIHIFKPKGYSGLAAIILIISRWFKLIRASIVLDTDDWEGYGGFNNFYRSHNLYPKIMLDFFHFQEKWIPKHCDFITVASRTLETQMWGFDIPQSKVVYIPNGPYKDWLQYADNKEYIRTKYNFQNGFLILLYTRFFEYDLKKVVNIAKLIRTKINNFKFLVVGKGDFGEEKVLQELIKREELSDFFIFAGWVQPEELPNYLISADVAIYPFDDNLLNRAKCPGKLMELMSMGIPVVGERIGQIGEYIENERSGILVDPEDINAFAENIIRILKDEDLRAKLGKGARERIWDVFGWNKSVIKVEECMINLQKVKK